ncbi:hypothetical protein Cni_G04547 [Canna indica]|uniref:LOB domain-containing protein n=1 Tax=Canna indica TaxID=4628 RepID=A0AAQ3JX80_9LILI|nr:hypothetical protein Cni_G04547 [Canna indica]
MLQELPTQQRADAVSSLVYEATARMRDPVYGCVGAISFLQNQVSQLQMQLAVAQTEILCIQMQQEPAAVPFTNNVHEQQQQLGFGDPDKPNFVIENSSQLGGNIPQMLNYASSSSNNNIAQDPLKREFLWA